jgi:Bacterial Ig-like domain
LGLSRAAAPVQGLPSSNDPVVQVGHLEADAAWFYRVDGQAWVQGQGSSIPANVFAAQGQHRVEVYQTDLAGNSSAVASLDFWFDSVAPDQPSLALAHDTGDTTDHITSDATLVVSGVQPGDDWFYQVDDGAWQPGQGQEISDAALGGDGVHTVRVRVRDTTGNESATASITVQRDTVAPTTGPTITLEFDTGRDQDLLTNTPYLLFEDLEAGARWSFSLDGGQTWRDAADPTDLAFRDDTPFEHDGVWTVLARQIDVAGNVGSVFTQLRFELDRQAPDAPTIALKHDTGLLTDDRVTQDGTVVIGDVEAGGSRAYRLDGSSSWIVFVGGELPPSLFTDGHHVVEVVAWDAAGNQSAIERLEFLLDTQAPGLPSLGLGTGSPAALLEPLSLAVI